MTKNERRHLLSFYLGSIHVLGHFKLKGSKKKVQKTKDKNDTDFKVPTINSDKNKPKTKFQQSTQTRTNLKLSSNNQLRQEQT